MEDRLAVAVVGVLALAGCAGTGGARAARLESVSLVGFSILEQANKQVIADWNKTDDGKDVTFESPMAPRVTRAGRSRAGSKADVVHFSLEPDVKRLVDSKQVAGTWKDTPDQGNPDPVGRGDGGPARATRRTSRAGTTW